MVRKMSVICDLLIFYVVDANAVGRVMTVLLLQPGSKVKLVACLTADPGVASSHHENMPI